MSSGLNSFADLDSAFRTVHKPEGDKPFEAPFEMPNEFAHAKEADPDDVPGMDAFDLGSSIAKAHDPTALDWEENPIDFKEFCEHKDHMDLLPSDWKKGEEGALSYKQYEDCMELLGTDPKLMFDPDTRKYLFAGFLWAKGCLSGDTLIFDEHTKKSYTVKYIVDKNLKIFIKSYNEKTDKIVTKEVSRVFSKGIATRLKVKFKYGREITVSADHRFYTGEKWIDAKKLLNGTELSVLEDGELTFDYVISTLLLEDGEVFELTVDDETPNYFTADGILHHNSGKDYICSILQAYIVYILLCLKNPQDYFGFAPGEACDIINVGKKGKQAERVYFAKFRARILNWEWMKNKYNIIDEGKRYHFNSKDHPSCKVGTRSAEWLNKNVRAFSENSANPESFEGYNVVFYLCDEISGWVSESERKVAKQILSVLRSSQGSRSTKKLRGLGMAISYPRQDDDIMFEIEKESNEENSKVYFSRGYQQEIKPQRFYSGKTFRFNAGTEDRPEWFDIPIELDEDFFKKSRVKAKGMYLLRPPTVADQFFEFTDKIDLISHKDRQSIFKVETDYTKSMDGHGNQVLYVRKNVVGLNREPLRDIDYVGWIDIGDVTCDAVLSIAHLETVNMIEGGNQFETRVVVVDQTIVWVPDKKIQKIVDVGSIANCCITMLKYINLKVVWYDHWNSSVGVKDLRDQRILCDRHNLTGDEYTHFKDTIYANRFIAPECPETNKGIEQVKHLSETKTGNVTTGSTIHKKDISDTWCGVVSLLLGKLAKTTFRAGTAPNSINVMAGKGSQGISTAGTPQGASSNNPFSGGMNQMGSQLIKDHSGMFKGLNPSVGGTSHNTGRGSKQARPSSPQGQERTRFPRGRSI